MNEWLIVMLCYKLKDGLRAARGAGVDQWKRREGREGKEGRVGRNTYIVFGEMRRRGEKR